MCRNSHIQIAQYVATKWCLVMKERILLSTIRNAVHPAIAGLIKSLEKRGNVQFHRYRKQASKHGVDKMNQALVDLAADYKPTIFMFEKGETIRPATAMAIKSRLPDCVVIQQSPDWYPNRTSSQAKSVIKRGKSVDMTLFPFDEGDELGASTHQFYRDAGCKRTHFWYKGIDPEEIQPLKIEPIADIVFLGAVTSGHPWGSQRLALLNYLAANGLNVHIHYAGNERLHKDIVVHGYTSSAYPEVASLGKINIDWRGESPYMCTSSDRIFPAMASQLCYLTSPFGGIETLFENEKHLLWYNTTEEALALAKKYIADDKAREKIARAARKRVIEVRSADVMADMLFSYIDRFRQGEIMTQKTSSTGIPFDRCIRVGGKHVYIIQGEKYLKIGDYKDLPKWAQGENIIEDVEIFDFTGMKEAKRLTRPRKKKVTKPEQPDTREERVYSIQR